MSDQNKSRRAALGLFAGAGALAIAPAVAIAATNEPDPIFAAIERHKEAWQAFSAACDPTDEISADQEGRAITEDDEAAWDASEEAEREAFYEAIGTAPITVRGIQALLEYAIKIEAGGGEVLWADLGATLLKSPVLVGDKGGAYV